MKEKKTHSIQQRLSLWFLLITLTPMLVILIVIYLQTKNSIEQQTFDKLTAIRDLKTERLNDWLAERAGNMLTITADKELTDIEYLSDNTLDPAKRESILKESRKILVRYLKDYPAYYNLFIIEPNDGRVLVSTDPVLVGTDKSEDPAFLTPIQTKSLSISDIHYDNDIKNYSMVFSIPIFCSRHKHQHLIGILCAHIDLQNSLYKILLDRVGLGNTGETLIVNEEGVALNELRWHENAPLKLQITAEPATQASLGKTGVTISTDYRGEEVIAAYTYIPSARWGFVCKQDVSELHEPIRAMIWNFVLVFIIASIIVVVLILSISNSIARPIIAMHRVAQKISSGELSTRNINIKTNDELGSLAHEFNRMADISESKLRVSNGVAKLSDNLIGKTDIENFAYDLVHELMELCGAQMGCFYYLNDETNKYQPMTSIGANNQMLQAFSGDHPEGEFGNTIAKKSLLYLQKLDKDTIFTYKTTAGNVVPKELISIPVLVDKKVAAIISLVSLKEINPDSMEIIKLSWSAINSSYSNLISTEKTRILAEHLAVSNADLKIKSDEIEEKSIELQNQTEELIRSSAELQEQNTELEMQRKEVEEANQLKSEFLSNMSHELRTPLNSIMALSRVLIMQSSTKLDKEENSYLQIIERNGKRLLELINSILDLSKIEAGKVELSLSDFSPTNLLQSIKESMEALAQEKGIQLIIDIPEQLPRIESDESRLHQILTNIIGNAVKFTNKGSVHISATHDNEKLYIKIKDTGIGISDESLPYIFDEFRQADGTSSRQFEGTGLGLTIANRITHLLGGQIQVESRIGIGSVFTIILPISFNHGETNFHIKDETPVSVEKKSILVVDDHQETAQSIARHVKQIGFNSIIANSGKQALMLANKHKPFAITLDILMPDIDGLEVLQQLKQNPATKDIPVIMASVSNESDAGFALGAVGYLNKPIQKQALLSEILKLHHAPVHSLIVDDSPIDSKQLADLLNELKINTDIAHSGDECIKALKNKLPDIVFLDLMMPGMNGFHVLEQLRAEEKTKDLPVIIVTAKDLSTKEKNKLAGHATAILTKSTLTHKTLLNEISRIINNMESAADKGLSKSNKILLVEDNPEAIIQVKALLEKEGYNIDIALGGKEALESIKNSIPDGIILDLMMPEIDGFDVLEKIRGTKKTSKIPVLILTAKDLTKEDLAKLSQNNIQQLIQKGDIDAEGLLFKVKLMMGNMPRTTNKNTKNTKQQPNKPATADSSAGEILHTEVEKRESTDDCKTCILAIEDNPDNMVTIKAILKNRYCIAEAYDGETGLQQAKECNPALILLDMSLPGLSGEEVIKLIRKDKTLKNTAVIAVTAQAMKGDKQKFIRAGCDGYVSKPIDPILLIGEIEKLLHIDKKDT